MLMSADVLNALKERYPENSDGSLFWSTSTTAHITTSTTAQALFHFLFIKKELSVSKLKFLCILG